jgi:hypothetical protein
MISLLERIAVFWGGISIRFNIFLLAVCMMIQAISCSKEKLPEAGGTSLSKVIIRNKDRVIIFTADYIYTVSNQLAQINSKQNQGVESEKQIFSYDPSGNYIAYKSSNELFGDIYRYEFQYGGNGKITRANSTPFLANLATDDYVFTYDIKGRIIADSTVNRGSNFVTFYRTYFYDDKENVTDYKLFRRFGNDFQLFEKVTYTYDDKINPYYKNGFFLFVAGNPSILFLSRNNVMSAVSNGVSTSPGFYEYTYYSNGLVRASKAGYSNNGQTTEYYYQ